MKILPNKIEKTFTAELASNKSQLTLVFIDSGIDDYQLLLSGILSNPKVIVIHKNQDGIAQISQTLKQYPLANIHILAHGSSGCLQLGNSQLNLDNLHNYSQQIQNWSTREILIYACEVAAGIRGKTFLNRLQQLTGANIAASAGKIGNSKLGGTWELEVKIGHVSSPLALEPKVKLAYAGIFVLFANPVAFTVGASPKSLTVGTFAGDGNLDLAVANSGDNTVTVLLGDGTGNFSTMTNFTVGNNPIAIVGGEFSGNSQYQDLAVANYSDNNVSIRLNNDDGTGNFGTLTNFAVGTNPIAMVEGDFGNGKQDLAVANFGSNNISILLNNGTGNFSTATNFTVGDQPKAIAVGDFGNGQQDLAVVNYGDNNVTILLNDGTGKFTVETTLAVGNHPQAIAVGDFGNGHLDLAVANGADNTVTVWLGDGTGHFLQSTTYSVGLNPRSIVVGDFNGDGHQDLAVANYDEDSVSILLGNGTGGFLPAVNFSVDSPRALATGEFTSSGKQDLVVTNLGDQTVSTLINQSNPTLDFGLSNTSVQEYASPLTVVGTFSTNISDPQGYTYSLVSGTGANDNADFTINGNQLEILNSPDFETKPSYNIFVQATSNSNNQSFVGENLTISVIDISNPPSLSAGNLQNLTVLENSNTTSLGLAGLAYQPGHGNSGDPLIYTVTAVPNPELGNIYLADGTTVVTANTAYQLTDIQGMQFKPATNASSNVYGQGNFIFQVQDSKEPASDDVLSQSILITVNPVNQTPTETGGSIHNLTVLENANATSLGLANLAYSPLGNTLTYTITNVPDPSLGSIYLADGQTLVTANTAYQLTDIQGMQFKPATNANSNSDGTGTFSFTVQNNVGGGNGQNTLTQSLTITVSPVNQPPVLTAGSIHNLATSENASPVSLGFSGLAFAPGGGIDQANQTLTYEVTAIPNPSLGSIYLADGQTLVTANTAYQLTDIQGMQFKPTTNANSNSDGTGTFSFTVQNNGSTANGGQNTLTESLNIAIAAVNQPPIQTTGNINNLTVLENAKTTSLGFSGLGFAPGGGIDQASQVLNYTVTSVPDPNLGSIYLANGITPVLANQKYQLTDIQGFQFQPATNANSKSYPNGKFSFTVQNNGGTANGGQNTLVESLNISVTPVNQPPVLTAGRINDLSVLKNSGVSSLGLGGLTFAPGGGIDQANDSLTYTVIAVPDASLGNIVLADGTTPVKDNTNYTLGQIQGMEFQTASNAKGIGDFSFQVENNGSTANGGQNTLTESLAVTVNPIPLQLSNNNDVFHIQGDNTQQGLQVSIVSSDSNQVDELGVYTVDDAQGTINGIAPGASGYAQAALARGRVLFSAIVNLPNGFSNSSVSDLSQFNSGSNLRFYLVTNSTTDDILARKASVNNVLFSDPSNQKITSLGNNSFSLAWQDSSGNTNANFQNLVVQIQPTSSPSPLGSDLQGSTQLEVLDLRTVAQPVTATFTVWRSAAYNNFGGFYQVMNQNGDILVNSKTILHPGDSGYTQAAVSHLIGGIGLTVNQHLQVNGGNSQGEQTYTGTFQPGAIFAPLLIANGTPDAVLSGNPPNSPYVYFPFLGANPDQINHVRLLGNNTFAFEDQFNGGDRDYNDMIMHISLTPQSA